MIAVDLEKVLLAVCQGCNEEFSEESCEPGFCMIRSAIEDVPALTLDDLRPKGRWIEKEHNDPRGAYSLFHCSNCDAPSARRRNFCYECGADMRGYMSDGQRNQEG